MANLEAIKQEIVTFKKEHPLDALSPIKEDLKEGFKKGMTLTELCRLIRKQSELKPTAKSLREWLGLPKAQTKERVKKEKSPEKEVRSSNVKNLV